MNISEAKNKLVAWCLEQVGYQEGANNWNKYATKWTAAGGWNAQNQPWCDIFVDCAFIECFGLDLASKLTYQPKGGFSALCSASANYYKNNGAYFSTPAVGDQIFFNVSGGINHTGIVVKVGGGIVETIEGNSSDMVRSNRYGLGAAVIAGYGRPNWSAVSSSSTDPATGGENTPIPNPEPVEPTCTVTVTLPVIEYGDKGLYVKIMQRLLISKGFSCGWYGDDGDYGKQTQIALHEFQKKNSLEQDEICGQQTWKLLLSL